MSTEIEIKLPVGFTEEHVSAQLDSNFVKQVHGAFAMPGDAALVTLKKQNIPPPPKGTESSNA